MVNGIWTLGGTDGYETLNRGIIRGPRKKPGRLSNNRRVMQRGDDECMSVLGSYYRHSWPRHLMQLRLASGTGDTVVSG